MAHHHEHGRRFPAGAEGASIRQAGNKDPRNAAVAAADKLPSS